MIKVRSTLPEFVHNIIISDSDYFDIESGGIGNRIFKYYLDKKIISINFERETTKILQFNLDKYNDDIFMDELKRREFQTISDFIRSLFINYVNNLRTTREKIIFQDIFSPIENAINFGKQISIKYHGKVRRVDPYFIKAYEQEGRSYLFCYCYKCQDYRNYKISDIKIVYQHVQNRVERDSEYIENVLNNFDPFLSYSNKVKVSFTEEGLRLYKRTPMNRPKLLEKKDDQYLFECDNKLALVYFPQFYSNVEILEPKELREVFKNKLLENLKLYN